MTPQYISDTDISGLVSHYSSYQSDDGYGDTDPFLDNDKDKYLKSDDFKDFFTQNYYPCFLADLVCSEMEMGMVLL